MVKLVLLSLLCAALTAGSPNPFEKRTPFKEATLHYTLSGATRGTSTLYVKEYGKYLAEYERSRMNLFGMGTKAHKLTLSTPDWIYTIDLNAKTGSKVANIEKYMQQEYAKLTPKEQKRVRRNARKTGTNVSHGLGGSVKFNAAMIKGYSCDKTTILGITSYTIHNTALVLKLDGTIMGMKIHKEITAINKGAVDSSRFTIPDDIVITYDPHSEATMQEQAAQMMQMLLHPTKR